MYEFCTAISDDDEALMCDLEDGHSGPHFDLAAEVVWREA